MHHLDEDEAVRFLAELGRVSRRGIVVNDLHRGHLGLLGAWLAGRFLTRNRYTRDDSLLAIKRAGADMILTYFAREVAEGSARG